MWYKLLMPFFLSDMVQNTVAQAILTPLQRLPTANQQHVGTSRTIPTRLVTNETSILIFKIFDHFRNMHPDNLQPNPMNRRDIVRNTVSQPLLTPLSRGYVWQDVKDRVIKPVVIMNFPNIDQTNRHLNYPSVGHPHVADEARIGRIDELRLLRFSPAGRLLPPPRRSPSLTTTASTNGNALNSSLFQNSYSDTY
ncbi:hypothetical protein Tco_0732771 [Tanacetum coccineum]